MIDAKMTKEYLETVGKPGLGVIAIIRSLAPYIETLNTEPGRQLLEYDILQHSELLNKIYTSIINTGSADQKDVIMLQLIDSRLKMIYEKIKKYEEMTGKVKSKEKP